VCTGSWKALHSLNYFSNFGLYNRCHSPVLSEVADTLATKFNQAAYVVGLAGERVGNEPGIAPL
jgi:hypothetical protein